MSYPDCPQEPASILANVRIPKPLSVRGSALLIQPIGGMAELKDGSIESPIKLPKLQSYQQNSIPTLLGMLPDGTLVAWKAGSFPGVKKLDLKDSQFTIVDNYTPDMLSSLCEEANCNLIDGVLGFKTVTFSCAGSEPKTKYQIVRAPSCCCETSGDGSGLDVWSPNPPYYGEGVPVATGRWVGTVPRNFVPTHVRLSCGYNNGVSLDWELETIGGVIVAKGTWEYTAGVLTKVIPYSLWETELSSQELTGGLHINLNTDPSGAYATVMSGFSVAFLGTWS